MNRTFAYMRISTKEERGKQKFTRQEMAIERWSREHDTEISSRRIYKDDASGKSFDRPAWKELESDIQPGDTIIFKDICRFTREYEAGFQKYMELMNGGINLIFIDNPMVSTDHFQSMLGAAEKHINRVTKKQLNDIVEWILCYELDRAEMERETTVQRIRDGIKASPKKSGRKTGNVDKLTDALKEDLKLYNTRRMKGIVIMKKHGISRNTLKKYAELIREGA